MGDLLAIAAVLTIVLSFIRVIFFDDREDRQDRNKENLDKDFDQW